MATPFPTQSRVLFALRSPLGSLIALYSLLFGAGTEVERTPAEQRSGPQAGVSFLRPGAPPCAGADAGTLAGNVNKRGAEPLIFI